MSDLQNEQKKQGSTLFNHLLQAMEDAFAYQRGEPVKGTRVHQFERLPDGTVRRVGTPVEF